jgi:hypothetical protein
MYLTQINDTIYKKIRGRNDRTLSNLNTFIRVFSGANNTGLVIESNPDWKLFKAAGVLQNAISSVYGSHSAGSGTIGVAWDGKTPIEATTGAPARPRPTITLFNVKEGQDQISKEANLNITAYSIEQLEIIQQYFMEPGYSLFVEWGWNTPKGVGGLIKSDKADTIIQEVGERSLTDELLQKKRKESNGDYDCFFGFITGGEVTSEGNLFNVNIQMRGVPSLPAFLQSHHSLYDYKSSGLLNSKTVPLYGESELTDSNPVGKEPLWDLKEKRFKTMFNNLPAIKQTKEVNDLIRECAWYDFIGFDLDVAKKLGDEFQVNFFEKLGYIVLPGIFDDPGTIQSNIESGIPIEKFVSNEQYIRFGFAMDILNANAKTVKYTVSGKDLKSYIDIKNTKIGAFPFIFSTKKEKLLIPGELPNFSKILESLEGINYNELTIGDDGGQSGTDLSIQTEDRGIISFVQNDNLDDSENEKTFKEIKKHYGLLENLYINFQFFKNTITASNKNMREILTDLLNGMSDAVNSFWNFQIIETPGDDGLLTIKIFDENWAGQLKEVPKYFYHSGTKSVFLDASLNVKIPAEMMGQIINRRFQIASQPEQAIVNIGNRNITVKQENGAETTQLKSTFFATGPDLFLKVNIGEAKPAPPPKKIPFVDGSGPVKTFDATADWKSTSAAVDFQGQTKEQKEINAAQNKTALDAKVSEVKSLGIATTKKEQPVVGRPYTIYYNNKNEEVARSVAAANGTLTYSGKSPEQAKAYDDKLANPVVAAEVQKIKEARKTSFSKALDKMDILVKPNMDSSFTIAKTDAFEQLKDKNGSFGIYCYNDPIYFDKLKNNAIQNYFKINNEKGPLSTLLPITYKFKILGCSGLRRWDSFIIRGIPKKYEDRGVWQITEIEHGLSGMQWVTEVTANYRQIQ